MCRDPVEGKLPPGKVREVLLAVSTVLSHLVGVRIEDCDWNWELELVPGPHSDLQQRKHKYIKIRSSNIMQICSVKTHLLDDKTYLTEHYNHYSKR